MPFGSQPRIRRDRIDRNVASAINHHRDFRTQPLSQPGGRYGGADALRHRQRIGDFTKVQTSKRTGLHRHADAHGDAQVLDILGKGEGRGVGKTAKLQTASRCHLNHAIAVARRRFAKSDQAFGRKPSGNGQETNQ